MHKYDLIYRHYLYHYSSLYILEEYNQSSLDSLLKSFHFGGFTEWFLSLSIHNRLGIMLTFDTTHEYYLGDAANIYYCSDHETLILTKDYEDKLLINGISKDEMLKFARKFYTDSLQDELTQEDKDALSKVEA